MAIDTTAVARGTGVEARFRDMANGTARFVPQHIVIMAPGEDSLSYPLDKLTLDGGRSQAGAVYGFNSPIYHIAEKLMPQSGSGIGTIRVDVIPLANPATGAAAVGDITIPSQTLAQSVTVYPKIGGVRSAGITVPAGVVDTNKLMGQIADSISQKLGVPCKASKSFGSVVAANSANISLTGSIVAGGNPSGGDYVITCADAANQLFNVSRPDGSVAALLVAAGSHTIDGLNLTITATAATANESAKLTVEVNGVDLAIAWKGDTGNAVGIDIQQVGTTAQLTWAKTDFNGGGGTTDVAPYLAKVGEDWVTAIITTESDVSALDAFLLWGEGRWDALVKKPCNVFYGSVAKTPGEATINTQSRDVDRVTFQLPVPGSSEMPWAVAAGVVAPVLVMANNNPASDYGSQRALNVEPGPDEYAWNYSQRDLAIKNGSSTTEKKNGVVTVSDVVSPWSPVGEDPPAYRYLVDIVKLQQVIYNLNLAFDNEEWDGAPIVDGPTVNERAKTVKMVKATVAQVLKGLAAQAIITRVDESVQSITVTIPQPKRLNVRCAVRLSNNANIRDVVFDWGFNFG